MSRIANPLYDTTFKYLMEDEEIAEGFISAILDRKVKNLEFKSRSSVRVMTLEAAPKDKLELYHLDFKATIYDLDEDGNHINSHDVLIELQKGFYKPDIYRFRDYLASELSPDKIKNKKIIKDIEKEVKEYDRTQPILPIINIYILGFPLVDKEFLIRKPGYYLNSKGEIIHPKSDFVHQVNLDPIIIQIPFIPEDPKDNLEEIMSLFIQKFYQEDTEWVLNYNDNTDIHNPIVDKMKRKLGYILADDKARKDLKAEDDGRLLLNSIDVDMRKANLTIEKERKKAEAAERKAKESERKAEEERKNAEEERKNAEESDRKAEEERKKAEEERKNAEEERKNAEESDRKAEAAERKVAELMKLLEKQ